MSSAISVLSSITGLIAVAEQIINTANQLYQSDKDAPQSISRIKNEMQGLQELFIKVHLIILGKSESKPNHSRLAMISIHHLITVLSGCVLVSSSLGELLSQAVGIVKARASSSSNEGLERTGWIKWREGDVDVVMNELQHYKSILEVMLNVIHCNSNSEAKQSLVRLDELVAKTLDYKTPISPQLTELIRRQDPAVLEQSAAGQDSSFLNTYDDNDAVSIKTSTTLVGSVLAPGTFMDELKKSRPYKRLHHQGSSASVFSTTSLSTRGGRWSLLSSISLGDLSISEIAVLELPICEADLRDPTPYRTSGEAIKRTEPPPPRWYLPRMMSILRRFETRIVGIAPYLNPNNTSIPNELTPLIHAVFEGREAACLSLLKPETPPFENVLNEAAVTPVHFRRLVHKSSTDLDICAKLFLSMAFGDDVGRCVRWICKHLLVALEQGDNETARALLEHPQLQVDLIVNSASDFRFADLLSESPVTTRGSRKTSKYCGPIHRVLHAKVDLDNTPAGKWPDYFKSNRGIKGDVEAAHLLFLRFAHARTQTENAPLRPKDNNQNTIHPYYQDAIDIFAGNSAFESLRSSVARKNKDSGNMAQKSSADSDKQPVYNPPQQCKNSECLCTLLSSTRPHMEVQLGPPSGTSHLTSYDPKSGYDPKSIFNKDMGLDQAISNNCLRAAKLLLILGANPAGIESQEKHAGSSITALARIYGQNNPLVSAIEKNNTLMVKLLLEGGAAAHVTLTPEFKAVIDNIQDKEISKMLLLVGEHKRSGN